MKDTPPSRARFGTFELNVRSGELRAKALPGEASGHRIVLPEQPFQLLIMLVERGGSIVTRQEIKNKFWPNDTIVEFDHSINVAIGKLRKALGDSAEAPRYISTLASRGYRLIVPVEWIVAAEDALSDRAGRRKADAGPAPGEFVDWGILSGRTVSHYRVLDIVGGGGMGVVYRAEDLKLGRRVALKFLPEELSSDPQALERFEREARAASSLDHPNICPIYEFGEHAGHAFIVMQLLEGQTLRERLAEAEGPLPLEALLDVGTQVSEGLEAAHERGIIHRDIKPANIFVTSKGVCKILDFGLAKLFVEAPGFTPANPDSGLRQPPSPNMVEATASRPTMDEEGNRPGSRAALSSGAGAASIHFAVDTDLTRTGATIGTAGYMSPEQVLCQKLDTRSDVFSFGLVLYEMATGHRAFQGDTAQTVRDAILHQPQVPARDLNPQVPLELEVIIDQTLQKEREARYQTAAQIGADLKRMHRDLETAPQKSPRFPRMLLLAAIQAIILGALALGFRWYKHQPTVTSKTLRERQLTHNPAENHVLDSAISPDGRYVAYVDPKGLHLSLIESGEIHDIPLAEELRTHLAYVRWFPDGETLLFTAYSDAEGLVMWTTSVFGGSPHKLGSGRWPQASSQSSLLAFVSRDRHEIWVMGAAGENAHKILADKREQFAGVAWSPTGERLAYIKSQGWAGGSIETVAPDGTALTRVVTDSRMQSDNDPTLAWALDGHIIFAAYEIGPWQTDRNLWEITTDSQTGNPSEQATKITFWDNVGLFSPTISKDGRRLAVLKAHVRDDVYIGELKDNGTRLASPARFTISDSEDFPSGWTRDSKAILFSSNRTGRQRLFRQEIGEDIPEPIVGSSDDEGGAELSPDARWILYWSTEPGRDKPPTVRKLMRFPTSGGSAEQILEAPVGELEDFDCPARPGGSCVLIRWDKGQLTFHAIDPVRGPGKEMARTTLPLPAALDESVSPEGSRIAITSRDQLRDQVRLLDFRNGTERNLSLPHGWSVWSLSWTADGAALFATVAAATGFFVARIDLDGKTTVLLDRGKNQWLSSVCTSPDGRHLAFSQRTVESNAWLLESF